MDNKSSLTKILNVVLKKKHPSIQEIKVYDDIYYKKNFDRDVLKVWVGINYIDFMMNIDDNKLKREIHDLSKLVLTDGSYVELIQFFEPKKRIS